MFHFLGEFLRGKVGQVNDLVAHPEELCSAPHDILHACSTNAFGGLEPASRNGPRKLGVRRYRRTLEYLDHRILAEPLKQPPAIVTRTFALIKGAAAHPEPLNSVAHTSGETRSLSRRIAPDNELLKHDAGEKGPYVIAKQFRRSQLRVSGQPFRRVDIEGCLLFIRSPVRKAVPFRNRRQRGANFVNQFGRN
ncbi:hypothetical protein Jann_2859 [Jannaschia sp. CCS1]|nr:hypothetical protein Jann_2859 [Jannaschia sp. CCS1]